MLLKVLSVLICMALIISKVSINWGNAFFGFVPSKELYAGGSLYTCMYFLVFYTVAYHGFSGGDRGCYRDATQSLSRLSPCNTGSIGNRFGGRLAKMFRDFIFASIDVVAAHASIYTPHVQPEKTVQYFPLG